MSFDPEAFANIAIDGPTSTKMIPVPAGEYIATVKSFKARSIKRDDGESAVLDVMWQPEDADGKIKAKTKRDVNTVRQSVWLDLTPNGALASGEGVNDRLGVLRECLGQNKAGVRWTPAMLVGGVAKIVVKHKPRKDEKDVEGRPIVDAVVDKVLPLRTPSKP